MNGLWVDRMEQGGESPHSRSFMWAFDAMPMEKERTMTRMLRTRVLVGLSVAVLWGSGCGKKEEPAPSSPGTPEAAAPAQTPTPPPTAGQMTGNAPAQSPDMSEAVAQAQQMFQQTPVEAVAPATLKDMLPAELPGMKRLDASAESAQMGSANLTRAHGEYGTDSGGSSIEISITDAGSLTGPMRIGLAGWSMAQYDRQTETGYQKTTTYSGYKAMEEYDTQSKSGSMRVFVADRFVVEAEGDQTTMEAIKQALGKIDVKKLAALK
jgi:hypothetical protein